MSKLNKSTPGIRYNRKYIMQLLEKKVAPCYPVGMHYLHSDTPYLVLKALTQYTGITRSNGGEVSREGGWQYYDIMVYTPADSIVEMDDILDEILSAIRDTDIEFEGNLSEDYLDEEINMYMRSFEVRVPKEVYYNG